jgi:hypothetical protein
MAAPSAWFEVLDLWPQDLRIRVRGGDVLSMQPHAPDDLESPLPDLGQLAVSAARAGLFGGADSPPWAAAAELLATDVDLDAQQVAWRIRVDRIDPGAFRIIWNLLQAMDDLAEVYLGTDDGPAAGRVRPPRLDPARLAFPATYRSLPFTVSAQPAASSNDRSIQIVFAAPPSDAQVNATLAAFETWTTLLLFGGYAPQGMSPRDSGALPDPPFQLDGLAVEQAFPDRFVADEAAFSAVINHAVAVHHAGSAVSEVIVR